MGSWRPGSDFSPTSPIIQILHAFSFRSCCSIEIINDGGGAIENTGRSALKAVFEQADAKLLFFFMTLQQVKEGLGLRV